MLDVSPHRHRLARPRAGRTIGPLLAAALIAVTAIAFTGAAQAQVPAAQVPTVDIKETCKIAATAMLQLMGGSSLETDQNVCLNSEQRARESIVKDWATFSAADRTLCVQTEVYLPSYVEWLTCMEMNRDVRRTGTEKGPYDPVILPTVRPKVLY
jgi:hypothetical protein